MVSDVMGEGRSQAESFVGKEMSSSLCKVMKIMAECGSCRCHGSGHCWGLMARTPSVYSC